MAELSQTGDAGTPQVKYRKGWGSTVQTRPKTRTKNQLCRWERVRWDCGLCEQTAGRG